ncbi:Sulfurtransferase TusA [Variovorax sp. PDC80]|uniref:sulfurtransferase TusA family protein n=1 Tax=Variovorax sp. PDC80 TaxID=1882827 RepID=UPI0008EED7A9|nr:sulfurtransferase TusA family protein [Variovorax sp. PDC80]SFP17623.1 Sulfurtransferase TusA [Variovorax sp. PDC80]
MSDPHAAFLPARPAPTADCIDDSHGPALRIDTRGTHCPQPMLRLRKAIARSAPGQLLVLAVDDPVAFESLADALPALPVQLLGSQRDGACRIYTLLRR